MTIKNLYFITSQVDHKDYVLSQTIDWIRALAPLAQNVQVIALKFNKSTILPSNVLTYPLSSGSFLGRLIGVYKLYRFWALNYKSEDTLFFFHMASWGLFLLGPLNWVTGKKQVIWYSHNYADVWLRASHKFANLCVSPTKGSFPLDVGSKLITTGHAINFEYIEQTTPIFKSIRDTKSITCIGRVTKVKQIEVLIAALMKIEEKTAITHIELVGPVQDSEYLDHLNTMVLGSKFSIVSKGPLHRKELMNLLAQTSLVFNDTPKSIDKAALEAAFQGNFILSNNYDLLLLTGMSEVWMELGYSTHPNLDMQILALEQLSSDRGKKLRKLIKKETWENNSIESTVGKIFREVERFND